MKNDENNVILKCIPVKKVYIKKDISNIKDVIFNLGKIIGLAELLKNEKNYDLVKEIQSIAYSTFSILEKEVKSDGDI